MDRMYECLNHGKTYDMNDTENLNKALDPEEEWVPYSTLLAHFH